MTAAELPQSPPESGVHDFLVDAASSGLRLDRFLAACLPSYSRSRLQLWIEDGAVAVNGASKRSRDAVYAGDRVHLQVQSLPQDTPSQAQPMDLDIVWEDEHLIIVNKPAGLVVHPGAGNRDGTLLNGLLAHDPRLAEVPRAGIVHRLDVGTSGLLAVARTLQAQTSLVRQLAERTVAREYWAVVAGSVAPTMTIDAAIERDPRNPLRFRCGRSVKARPARTHVRSLEQWRVPARLLGTEEAGPMVSWVACRLDTGRTHQIRVHLESLGHPLLGDPMYRKHLSSALASVSLIGRPALHAVRLELDHPITGEPLGWSCAVPADLAQLLKRLGARPSRIRPPAQLSIEIDRPAPDPADDLEEFPGDEDD